MTIVQPRIDNLSEWEISISDLLQWANNVLTPAAKKAYTENGEQVPGKWCQFCKVKSSCKALAQKCIATVQKSQDPRLLKPEELAKDVLPELATVKTWLTGVEDYALEQALAGVKLPGWKVVEGRSNRKITDPDGVATTLSKEGYKEEQIYKPTELVSLTGLEKLTGKKRFAELCGKFIEKPQGKPTLAPESDKRPAFNSVAEDFKDID